MNITRSGIAALVAMCGAAGAGGAYLATRGLEPATSTLAASATGNVPVVVEPVEIATSATPTATIAETRRAVRPVERRRNPEAPSAAPRVTTPLPVSNTGASSEPVAQTESIEPAPQPEPVSPAPPAVSVPVEPDFDELIVSKDTVLGLQFESTITSDTARVEDRVVARVTRDVRVGDRVAIPSGAQAFGEVTSVERGGRLRARSHLAVRFTAIALPDGTRMAIASDVIIREGDPPSRESAAKIGGGAIGGAIVGGILGGGKGAILGGTAGAGAGTAAVMAGGRNVATLSAGTPVTVRLIEPATVQIAR